MRVVRGRGANPTADREVTRRLAERAASGTSTVRIWRPHRTVVFGRRDTTHEGYDRARRVAKRRGFTPVERSVGGHAVAFTGDTVAVLRAEPVENPRTGIQARYDRASREITAALERLGVAVEPGEPERSFCPGTHSLSAQGKIVGLAQRVHNDAALVSGVVVVSAHDELGDVLEPVYGALELPFDGDTVGSVARAGGPSDSEAVIEALQAELTENPAVECVRET